jgi:hypothetical protein
VNLAKEVRFKEFLKRLAASPVQSSREEALELLARTLNAVEDEMTDIPNRPEHWQTDDRMYPPQVDNLKKIRNRPDVVRFRSRGHNTFIRDNGAIEIQELRGRMIFQKNGSDGLDVWGK